MNYVNNIHIPICTVSVSLRDISGDVLHIALPVQSEPPSSKPLTQGVGKRQSDGDGVVEL